MPGVVVAVSQSESHRFSKTPRLWINLLAGLGVEGDAHVGATVQHRSRVARDPSQPNLRQVHLLHEELFAELAARGFPLGSGDIGENILTRGVDLLSLPTDTILQIGRATLRMTGLRNPCIQLDRFQRGLMAATLGRNADGNLIRKAGVMSVVVTGGDVRVGDAIEVLFPPKPHCPLHPV